jgi:hypothetical protein
LNAESDPERPVANGRSRALQSANWGSSYPTTCIQTDPIYEILSA